MSRDSKSVGETTVTQLLSQHDTTVNRSRDDFVKLLKGNNNPILIRNFMKSSSKTRPKTEGTDEGRTDQRVGVSGGLETGVPTGKEGTDESLR